jgi:uncharacterized protein (TIGR00730 family)
MDDKKPPGPRDNGPNSNHRVAITSAGVMSRESWKIFQIMAEFVAGFERLSQIQPSVSIFGSSRIPPGHPYYALTEEIARKLSDAGFAVVSGGGPGLMEAANKGAFYGKSPSVGLHILLPQEQKMNEFQDVSLAFQHFFARKVMFVKYAKAYVVMPGGFGTLDEVIEALTLIQTGKSTRMPIVLVHSPYWKGLVGWFQRTLIAEGMIDKEDLNLFTVVDSAEEVLEAIFRYYEQRGFEPSEEEREIKLNL